MPWVVADYSSEVLDLEDPATFRDLAKPIGALEPSRLKSSLERYELVLSTNLLESRPVDGSIDNPGIHVHVCTRFAPACCHGMMSHTR